MSKMFSTGGWRKSTRCECSACVEVRRLTDGVQVRDTKWQKAHGPRVILEYTDEQWDAFLTNTRSAVEVNHYLTLGQMHLALLPLQFTDDERDALLKGILAGEFDLDKL